jgi:transmembrane sensor
MDRLTPDQSNPSQIEDQAWNWIIKFEGDTVPTSDELKALHAWIAQSPAHHQTLKRLSLHWQSMDALQALSVPGPRRNLIGHYLSWVLSILFAPLILLATILQQTATSASAYPRRFTAAAAVLAITLGLFSWQQLQIREQGLYVTGIGEQSRQVLADGSVLRLNTNSRVQVSYQDSQRKVILLQGEAFFDVKPDPTRPFEVYAGTRMVRAIGTAFSVYLLEEQVEVTVSEGKVALGALIDTADPTDISKAAATSNISNTVDPTTPSVYPMTQVHEIVGSLLVGQSVVIPAGAKGAVQAVTEHEKADLKRRLAWLEGQLIYAGENLETVVKDISRYTPVYIELADPNIKTLRIGGQSKVGEVEALFSVLETGFGLKVTRLTKHHVQITR